MVVGTATYGAFVNEVKVECVCQDYDAALEYIGFSSGSDNAPSVIATHRSKAVNVSKKEAGFSGMRDASSRVCTHFLSPLPSVKRHPTTAWRSTRATCQETH